MSGNSERPNQELKIQNNYWKFIVLLKYLQGRYLKIIK